MYENIISEIENYENQLKASITTNNTIMKLKNLKLEDVEKEITNARKDENISNEELFSIYEKRDEIIKEIEAEKAKIDFNNVKEEYNMLKERHLDLVKKYKEIENKKEKTTNEYILGELNKDAAYIIQSLENLTIPFSELNNRVNNKEEKLEEKVEPVEEENRIISNDENIIKDKIQIVQENIGKELKVVEEPATNSFTLKKGPATYQEFAAKGFAEPEKDKPLRRMVKAIKNKLAEWGKKEVAVSEEQLLAKEESVIEPIIEQNNKVPEEQLLNIETPVIDNSGVVNENVNAIGSDMIPEEQILNLNIPQEQNVVEEQINPIYNEVSIPEVNQEMSFDEIYNPVNMQMNQGKSL